MDDRVERVQLEHQRQVMQFHYPDAIARERRCDVGHELARVLEVVEHRDRGDHLGLTVGVALLERSRREEVVDHLVALLDRVARNVGGVVAEVGEVRHVVAVQQRAVIAADVDHEIARSEADQLLRRLCDAVEILGHRAVDPAAVPVGVVEDRSGDGLPRLDQAAGILVSSHVAANELQRDRALHGLRAARLGECARDVLVAQLIVALQPRQRVFRNLRQEGRPHLQVQLHLACRVQRIRQLLRFQVADRNSVQPHLRAVHQPARIIAECAQLHESRR